jgi:hypothetical protein
MDIIDLRVWQFETAGLESSGIEEEFDVYRITALLVNSGPGLA